MIDLAIAAVHRGEHAFLREWVEYHLMVGVKRFYLFNHDRDEDRLRSQTILRPYADVVLDVPWDEDNDFQRKAYDAACQAAFLKCEWLACLDVDEFLLPDYGTTVAETFRKATEIGTDVLCLPLATFGSGGHQHTPRFVTQSLITRAEDARACNWTCKYAYRTAVCSDANFANRTCRDQFGEIDNPLEKRFRRRGSLRVNHYPIKSEEWWRAKVARGWNDTSGRMPPFTKEIWDHKRRMADHNEVTDVAMQRFGPELEKRLA